MKLNAALLVMVLIGAGLTLGQAVPPGPAGGSDALMRPLTAAIALTQQNRPEDAKKLLSALIPQLPAGSLPRHAAELLQSQLTGAFAARQQAYLSRRVVDTVVLVPDEPTFLAAIAQWTPEKFWPVLIEDSWFAPLFIESFKPRKVVRFTAASAPAEELPEEQRRRQTTALAARALGEHIRTMSEAEAKPPGLVVIDPTHVQRSAALALAKGRFQPILALTTTSTEMKTAPEPEIIELNEKILAAMKSVKLLENYEWSGITLAGRFPIRFNAAEPKYNPLAVDDRLGRDERLVRRGVVGRLYGGLNQSVYMAMCSLFLQPEAALLFHTYGYNPESAKTDIKHAYHLNHVAETLRARMEKVRLFSSGAESVAVLRMETQPVNPYGYFWVNSSGGGTDQSMQGGPMGGDDMPTGRAIVINHVASWGLTDPWSSGGMSTKGLMGGAYWYFGSTHEPYLNSFVHSTELIHRATPGTPLSFAGRLLPGHPFYRPWKLMLFGDPLFAFRKAAAERVQEEIAGTTEITAAQESDSAAAKLRHALLTRTPAVMLAKQIVQEPAKLSAEDLAATMRLLYEAGERDAVLSVPERLAGRHLMGGVMLRRTLREQYDAYKAAKQWDVLGLPLARAAMSGVDEAEMRRWATRYLEDMRGAGRHGEGVRYLTQIKQQAGLSPGLAFSIEQALAK